MRISTNPGSMQAGQHGLTLGTSFFARSQELIAVARLLWISRCVLCAADFFVLIIFEFCFFSSNEHGLLQA